MPKVNNPTLELVVKEFVKDCSDCRSLTVFPFTKNSNLDVTVEINPVGKFLYSTHLDVVFGYKIFSSPYEYFYVTSFSSRERHKSFLHNLPLALDILQETCFQIEKSRAAYGSIPLDNLGNFTVQGMRELIFSRTLKSI